MINSAAYADCNPTGRIDARCYPDLQTATAAALAADVPLWLPAGTYTLTQELVIDYAPLADSGFQIISDGAVIDATATGLRAMTITCSGGSPASPKGCFYFHIQGTLFVNANTWQAAVRFRPERFLRRVQFAEDRPRDRQQRRDRICGRDRQEYSRPTKHASLPLFHRGSSLRLLSIGILPSGGRSLRMADPETPAFRASGAAVRPFREGNVVRAPGLHKPGSNLSSLLAPRSSRPSAAHQRIDAAARPALWCYWGGGYWAGDRTGRSGTC
jgi:hypothetical protein